MCAYVKIVRDPVEEQRKKDYSDELGRVFRCFRLANGISLNDACELMNLSIGTIKNIETGDINNQKYEKVIENMRKQLSNRLFKTDEEIYELYRIFLRKNRKYPSLPEIHQLIDTMPTEVVHNGIVKMLNKHWLRACCIERPKKLTKNDKYVLKDLITNVDSYIHTNDSTAKKYPENELTLNKESFMVKLYSILSEQNVIDVINKLKDGEGIASTSFYEKSKVGQTPYKSVRDFAEKLIDQYKKEKFLLINDNQTAMIYCLLNNLTLQDLHQLINSNISYINFVRSLDETKRNQTKELISLVDNCDISRAECLTKLYKKNYIDRIISKLNVGIAKEEKEYLVSYIKELLK